jgi:hypothetical protein
MRRRLTLLSCGLLAMVAFTANAAGPSRAGSILGRPVIGVFPGAAPAIAPSFRSPIPRARLPGFRALSRGAVPIYAGLPAYYDPAYSAPPIAYLPPAEPAQVVVAPPPPERDVIQYAEGRYELRGDGVATPYRWAWIPNPPPPPRSGPDVRLYSWMDEQGGIHVTDRLNSVPERYRAEAKRNATS